LTQALLKSAGFHRITLLDDGRKVLPSLESLQPDLIILDVSMPFMSGLEVLERLPQASSTGVPVLMVTAHGDQETKQRALRAGAVDLLTRPFDKTELLLRVENTLRTRMLQRELQKKNNELEDQVRERTRELSNALSLVTKSREETLWLIGLTLEYRDYETKGHTERVTRLAVELGQALGLDATQLMNLRWGAYLHDIGKIAIADRILLKPGPLVHEEFLQVQRHVIIGERMLRRMNFLAEEVIEIVRHHHERWDGGGYPDALAGDDIPYLARVFSIADVYDALVSQRPYKAAWSFDAALDELSRQRGRQFDAQIVDAFHEVNIGRIMNKMSNA
jgi:putative two-component system response regulator